MLHSGGNSRTNWPLSLKERRRRSSDVANNGIYGGLGKDKREDIIPPSVKNSTHGWVNRRHSKRLICASSLRAWLHNKLALARRNSLILWENKKEELCEDYFKMPGGLKPNQYHTRYYVGLSRIRIFEYGIVIQVLPNFKHVGDVGVRCFTGLRCGL